MSNNRQIADLGGANGLDSSGGSSLVGFLQAGTGAVATTAADKLKRYVDVLDFIPTSLHAGIKARTNTTDLTTYIQAAVDKIITDLGGELYFPSGTYKTTDAISLSDPRACSLRGDGREVSIITRDNNTGPIVRLLNCSGPAQSNGYSFHWQGLQFRYTTPSATSDTNAIGVSFEEGAGDNTFGFVNWTWHDIGITSAYDCISNDWAAGDPPSIWGWDWTGVSLADFSHRAFYLTNGGVGAFPNCTAKGLYVQGRAGLTYTAAPMYCDAIESWTISLEYNVGTFNCDSIFSAAGARNLNITSARFEIFTVTGTPTFACIFAQGIHTVVGAVTVQDCTVADGVVASVVRSSGTGFSVIHSIQTASITRPGGGTTGIFIPHNGQCAILGPTTASAGAWLSNASGYDSAWLQVLSNGLQVLGSKVVGARDTGWTAGTGTANKAAYVTYAGQNVSAAYVEAEAQATDDAAKNASQRIKALEDAMRAHGLIN